MTEDESRADRNDGGLSCEHEPAVAYEVGFVVADDVDGPEDVDSACAMRATVHEVPVDSDVADGVGCGVEPCENHHERVAETLRRTAARHSGNVGGDDPGR